MSVLDYVAIGLIFFLVCLGCLTIVLLGRWPGYIASKREHPYRSAVTIGGWVTLFAGGIFYPLVLIWAYSGSTDEEVSKRGENS